MKKRCLFTLIFYWMILMMGLIGIENIASAAERQSVKVDVANVRSGPGANYDVLWKVEKYHPLKIIKNSSEWCQFIDFEGDKGWIHQSLLDKTPSVIVKKENCNIRSDSSTKSKILFRAGKGVVFKVLKRKGAWIHIQHSDGDKGWIYKSLVW